MDYIGDIHEYLREVLVLVLVDWKDTWRNGIMPSSSSRRAGGAGAKGMGHVLCVPTYNYG